MSINYLSLPPAFRTEAQAYIEHGQRPGALLMAVLDNSLWDMLEAAPLDMEAGARQSLIVALAVWVRIQAPCISRGSVLITSRWMDQGGLRGKAAAREAEQATQRISTLARETVRKGEPHIRLVEQPAPAPFTNVYNVADSILRHGPLDAQ